MLGSHDTNLVEFHQGELQYITYKLNKNWSCTIHIIFTPGLAIWVSVSLFSLDCCRSLVTEENNSGMNGIATHQ